MRPGACTNIENQNGRPLGEITLARNAEAKVRQEDNNTGVNPFLADRWIHAGENARLFVDYYDTWNNDSIRRAIYDAQNLPQSAAGIVHLLNNQTLWDLDLTNPRDAALELSGSWDESGWHANGLTLDGNTRTQYIDVRGGELHIKGSFENTDRIELHKEQGAVPRLSFVDKPEINGKLRIYVYDVES